MFIQIFIEYQVLVISIEENGYKIIVFMSLFRDRDGWYIKREEYFIYFCFGIVSYLLLFVYLVFLLVEL